MQILRYKQKVCKDEVFVDTVKFLIKNSEISETYNDNFVNIIEELRIYKWVNISPGCVLERTRKRTRKNSVFGHFSRTARLQ